MNCGGTVAAVEWRAMMGRGGMALVRDGKQVTQS